MWALRRLVEWDWVLLYKEIIIRPSVILASVTSPIVRAKIVDSSYMQAQISIKTHPSVLLASDTSPIVREPRQWTRVTHRHKSVSDQLMWVWNSRGCSSGEQLDKHSFIHKIMLQWETTPITTASCNNGILSQCLGRRFGWPGLQGVWATQEETIHCDSDEPWGVLLH